MNNPYEKQPFLEMIVLVVLMLLTALFLPQFKIIISLVPIIYVLVERRVRNRSQSSIGFKRKETVEDFKETWLWVLLVGVILQVTYFLVFKNFFPEVFAKINGRVTILAAFDGKLLFSLLVLAFGEEIVFRGLVQKRLGWVMKPAFAILLTSLLFTVMHYSTGPASTVLIDLATVFIDSTLFGIIFYKTNNVYLSWIAHFLANATASCLLINFV
ncbi:CPBP family intramembrane glutamic endopeptidase [Pseudalkalibacillus caeni]|uniref:CPBP family intramembrane metalloprotease n=1 Tax=Exobacillus caeni TaxID=2574798 RepID=A0A5R9F3P3_9BACL|nr:CPBP family intramembrane glutamic endopeptidase [Pseudalkalibacillus caeni]TLS37119.1 CPBP family intramembrane metalloprotease [Pseudalkalibacillus caeni]